MALNREIAEYYDRFAEETRLEIGPSQLEFERTTEILERVLPPPPARIVDVGGGAGAYSFWLAAKGYEVHLVDASKRLVELAERRNAQSSKRITSLTVGDARSLPQADDFADAVLVMGPLYHLQSANDRAVALREAARVVNRSGAAVIAAISRYASALDGLARRRAADPAFMRIRDRDLQDGHHLNDTTQLEYFTTAYFHRPEDLRMEMQQAGFEDVSVLGVEGPGWILGDFDARWSDATERKDLMDVARALESEPAIVGASAHLLGIGKRGAGGFAWGAELPALHGPRVELRWLTVEDAAALLRIFGDIEVMRFWSSPPLPDLSAARRLVAEIHEYFRARQLFQWGVQLKRTGELIGTTTLYEVSREHRRGALGFALRRDAWGQGFATETLDTIIRFAFETLDLDRLEADVDPENHRSLATLERQGFRREGHLRERWHHLGEVRDAVLLGLLRREWKRRQP